MGNPAGNPAANPDGHEGRRHGRRRDPAAEEANPEVELANPEVAAEGNPEANPEAEAGNREIEDGDHPEGLADESVDGRVTINVKRVSKRAWARAANAAYKNGKEARGSWLSRAMNMLADLEMGPREFPPERPGNPAGNLVGNSGNPARLSPDQLTARMQAVAAMMQGLAAVRMATGRATGKKTVGLMLASLEERQSEAEGTPGARLIGKASGQSPLVLGQSSDGAGQSLDG